MACGCGGQKAAGVSHRASAEIAAAQGAIDARRVMCLVCPARRGKAWIRSDERRATPTSDEKRPALGVCVGGAEPVMIGLTIAGVKACPKGRHPGGNGQMANGQMGKEESPPPAHKPEIGLREGEQGIVKWMGVRWLGVPMPIRWIAAALGRERGGIESVDALPGCGCVAWLKQKASAIGHWASVG